MPTPARILVAEPKEACRLALRALIASNEPRLRLVGEGSGGAQTLFDVAARRPDIVLLGMDEFSHVEMITAILHRVPTVRVVVLSEREDPDTLVESLLAGAVAFLPQCAEPQEILDALDGVVRGEVVVHPSLSVAGLLRATDRLKETSAGLQILGRLTRREREVMGLLSEGMTAGAIGERLFLSRRTVERHLATIYRKLHVHGKLDAVLTYRRLASVTSSVEVAR